VSQKTVPLYVHNFDNVGRFLKFFHCCILQEICNKSHVTRHTLDVSLHCLAKLKIYNSSADEIANVNFLRRHRIRTTKYKKEKKKQDS